MTERKAQKRRSKTIGAHLLAILAPCAVGLLSGCGGDETAAGESGDSPRASSGQSAGAIERPRGEEPEFDDDARYDGRTLDEYAVGLDDLNSAVRKRAMESILEFGVNAYPLKDRMRKLASEDPEDELRAASYVALIRMEDPDAASFLLDRMRDPDSLQTDRGWRMFLQVVVEEVDAELLDAEARELAQELPEHGEFLLAVSQSGVPRASGFRRALAAEVIGREHPDATVPLLVPMLAELELTPAERVAYVQENHGRLPSADIALQALRDVGDEAAFAALLAILAESELPLQQRLSWITAFPSGSVPDGRRLDAIVEYLPDSTESEAQQVFAALQGIVAQREDPGAGTRFQAILTDISDPGQDPAVRALALLYLCEGVGSGSMTAEGLDPVLAAIEGDDEEVVLGTALQELAKLVQRGPPEALADLPGRLTAAAYASSPLKNSRPARGRLDPRWRRCASSEYPANTRRQRALPARIQPASNGP